MWRDGLWKRLWDVGIRGKMWRVLRSLYAKTESCVEAHGGLSDWFEVTAGVRQGCILSPLLYDIFIDGLAKEISSKCKGIEMDNVCIKQLLYADDIVLIANSAEDLQQMLEVVQDYSRRWLFEVNVDKTKVLVFGSLAVGRHGFWTCYGRRLEEKRSFKYLGVDFSCNLRWKETKARLLTRAKRNMYKAWAMGFRGGFLSPEAAVNVYKGVIRSCLEYGVEYFGHEQWREADQIQYRTGCMILQVSQSAPSCFVQGELGLWSLQARRDWLRLRLLLRLLTMADDRVAKRVFMISRFHARFYGHRNWCSHTVSMLSRYSLRRDVIDTEPLPEHKLDWLSKVRKAIETQESLAWRSQVLSSSRMSEVRRIKSSLSFEPYLKLTDARSRQRLTKMRCGGGDLKIERLRGRDRVEREDRLCEVCDRKNVESERHALLECPAYNAVREVWSEKLRNLTSGRVDWTRLSDDDKLDVVLGGTRVIPKSLHLTAATYSSLFLSKLYKARKEVASAQSNDLNGSPIAVTTLT